MQLLLETEKALAASSGFVDVIEKQPGDGKGSSSAARGVTLHDEHQALIDKWKSTGVAQKRLQGLRKDMEKYRNVLDSLQSEKEQMERYERVKSEREVLERVAPLVAMRETRDQRDQLKEEHKLTKAQLKAAMIEVQRASEQSKLAREAQEASKKAVMKQKHIIKTLQAEVGKSDGPVKEAASKLRQLRASLKEQLEGKARKEHELTVAQAKLDDAVRELESQRSMEEHKEAIKKVRAMLTKLRQEMNESDARLDKVRMRLALVCIAPFNQANPHGCISFHQLVACTAASIALACFLMPLLGWPGAHSRLDLPRTRCIPSPSGRAVERAESRAAAGRAGRAERAQGRRAGGRDYHGQPTSQVEDQHTGGLCDRQHGSPPEGQGTRYVRGELFVSYVEPHLGGRASHARARWHQGRRPLGPAAESAEDLAAHVREHHGRW